MSDIMPIIQIKESSESTKKSNQQELRDVWEITKTERWKYMQSKLITDIVSQCLKEDKLCEELKIKIRSILLASEVDSCMDLDTKQSILKLLGLKDLDAINLSYSEQNELRYAVQIKLMTFNDAVRNDISKLVTKTNSMNNRLFHLSSKDLVLIDYKKKLNNIQKIYISNLLEHYSLLEQILHLKVSDFKDISAQKVDEYTFRRKIHDLQSQILLDRLNVDIYTQTSGTIDAYREIVKDILEQQDECHLEIDKLSVLKKKYEVVSSKQYDEILSHYLQYKTLLENKKMLYEQIKNK